MVTDRSPQTREKQLLTRVTKDFKAAFRRLANARGLTEAELLREVAEREVGQAAQLKRH